MAKSKSTPKKNTKKVTSIKPKLKQKQKVLHRLKALVRIVNLSVFTACIYCFYLIWTLPFWNIDNIELNGISKVGQAYIYKFVPEKSYKGINILTLNPGKVIQTLDNKRVFKSIHVYRSLFPTSLTINFEEREPYITIYDSTLEKEITLDDEGVVLTYLKSPDKNTRYFIKPKTDDKKIDNIPPKEDKSGKKDEDLGKPIYSISKVKEFKLTNIQMNAIRVIENLRNNKKIEDLGIFDITNPENIILNTEKNKVILGSLEELIMKIKSIPALEDLSKNNKNELEYIDVRYWKNPVLKLKKGKDSYEEAEAKEKLHN